MVTRLPPTGVTATAVTAMAWMASVALATRPVMDGREAAAGMARQTANGVVDLAGGAATHRAHSSFMPAHPLFTSYPFEDCRAHRREIETALLNVLEQGHYILGGEVAAFEREFAEWTGVRHAIGVANGTDAIELL